MHNSAKPAKMMGVSEKDRHMGYTYIEFYANELADERIVQAIADARR